MRKAFLLILISSLLFARTIAPNPPARVKGKPSTQLKSHTQGNMKLVISNWGFFGNAGEYSQFMWSCEFPAGSNQDYLFQGALWIGAEVVRYDTIYDDEGNVIRVDSFIDTLVSVGADGWTWDNEMFPGENDTIIERSILLSSPHYSPDAVSEQDFIAHYTDTVGVPYAPGHHTPMGIEVYQESYQWSYSYSQDFIIINFKIVNMNDDKTLRNVYVGLYIDGDCHPVTSDPWAGWFGAQDDITGFRTWKNYPISDDLSDSSAILWKDPYDPGARFYYRHYNKETGQWETIEVTGQPKYQDPSEFIAVAWIADADGYNDKYSGGPSENPSVTGTRVLYPPPEKISYNWWLSDPDPALDWGPTDPDNPFDPEHTPSDPYVESPGGNKEKYIMLSNGFFDPDQIGYRGVNADPRFNWPQNVDSINDTRYLLSFGPYNLEPHDTVSLIVAYIGGENFHSVIEPGNADWRYWDFSDLAFNASWAYRVYDNPGEDTDKDGYAGDYVKIYYSNGDVESTFVTGDGVPDFKGPPPPPAPEMEVVQKAGKIVLRWKDNAETFTDPFLLRETQDSLKARDFEGYRIYMSETGEIGSYTLLYEFDKVDYDTVWFKSDSTLAEEDTFVVFPIGNNLGLPEKDEDGWYELEIGPFLDYYPHYFSITAYDKGYYSYTVTPFYNASGRLDSVKIVKKYSVDPLESSVLLNRTLAASEPSLEEIEEHDLKVMVIPNPYIISEDYAAIRWEDWAREGWNEHKRRIIFTNLPERCRIRIYSLAGDLVFEIKHEPPEDPEPGKIYQNYEEWRLISRDGLGIVSGVYLFSVEELDENGNVIGRQLGKFVIIK
ncbi:hypothetical protein DRQ18_01845 [bacterium]|nr:MAG: hypothetical protein DRQ18_01845 [bacterium]